MDKLKEFKIFNALKLATEYVLNENPKFNARSIFNSLIKLIYHQAKKEVYRVTKTYQTLNPLGARHVSLTPYASVKCYRVCVTCE